LRVIVDGIIYQVQPHGGISRIYREIFPRMCDIDNSLHITLLTEGQLRQELPEHMQITHRAIPVVTSCLRPWRLWKSIIPQVREMAIKLRIGYTKAKIWHSTYYTMLKSWNGLSVVTVYDMIHERFTNLFNQQGDNQFRERKRRCILSADAVICISNNTREDIQYFYGIDAAKIWVVPLAHSNIFRQIMDTHSTSFAKTKHPFFLYVGDRVHYKNFDGILNAYSVWPGRKEVDILVVGKKWSSSEERLLMELGISDRVHLLTDIDDENLCRLYNQATAFIYPSLYEGFGIPLLEAMACGCPVIASRIPSTMEVTGDCPIYFEPGEMDDILHAFDNAFSENKGSERIQMGLKRIKNFSWNKTADQTLEVYKTISGR